MRDQAEFGLWVPLMFRADELESVIYKPCRLERPVSLPAGFACGTQRAAVGRWRVAAERQGALQQRHRFYPSCL
jgi:hypothetical protein